MKFQNFNFLPIYKDVTVGFSDATVASAFVLCTKVIGKRADSSIAGKDGR